MLFRFRRRDEPWEVVGSRSVAPVPSYSIEQEEELDIDLTSDYDTVGTYLFEIRRLKTPALQKTVAFAQKQVLEEVLRKKRFNLFLYESWKVTVQRRGNLYRIEVQYCVRPARALGKVPNNRPPPPFMNMLQDLR